MQIKEKTLQRLTPPVSGLCFITANTQSTHRSAPVHLQTCLASLPLVTQHTKKRGENQSPHKKSRWEYIIWSEKQFVLAISCLFAKVISLSSSISAGSSYWVGGGHYTTWLQNLHRPLQRGHWAREIHAEADCARSCFDWDRMITIPPVLWWHSLRAYILQSMHSCKGGGGACDLLWTSNCMWCLKSCYHQYSSNEKCYSVWFRAEPTSNYCVGVNHWSPSLYKLWPLHSQVMSIHDSFS